MVRADGLTGDTTAGRTLQDARVKAADIDDRLAIAAGPQAVTPLSVIVEPYVAQGRSPHKNRRPWKKSHKNQVETDCRGCCARSATCGRWT